MTNDKLKMTNEGKLFNKINDELKNAMKNKDQLRLSVLRMVKSKVLYVNAKGDLPDVEIVKIIKKYGKDLNESIEQFKKVGKNEEVVQHEKELEIVKEFLPKELSADEIKKVVQDTIKAVGAESIKEMGKVMKEITTNHPGIDGKTVSQLVREFLK